MTILLSIFLIGFTAMSVQIVILREFLTVFYGNELSIGLVLGSWLIWGAAGSWALGGFADKAKSKLNLFSVAQVVLSFLIVLSILAIRSIKLYFSLAPGEIIGFIPMLLSSFFILAPVCMLLGFMFSLGCRVYQAKSAEPAQSIGAAYSWESVGSLLGGLIASFIFIRFMSSIDIGVALGLLNILTAIALRHQRGAKKTGRMFTGALALIFVAVSVLWFSGTWGKLDEHSRNRQWQGYTILGAKNSIYGNIMVTKRDSQYSFFDNGLHLYSVPDRLACEETVHFALLEHKDAQDLLLIGGGVAGLIGEMLKYPVRSIDYLELDPLIVEMAEKYLPAKEYEPLKQAKVSIYNLDGRFFIKSTHKKYDCVIVRLGDPYTAQLNRYYTVEFFKEVKRVLNRGGVFSFALSSSESYISPELGEYLRSVYLGLKKVFKDVLVIPGETAYFLACDKAGGLTYDYNILMDRAKERNLDLKYVREYYLFSKLSPSIISYTEGVLAEKGKVKLNYDFQPSAYYYNISFWAARLGDKVFRKILQGASFKKVIISVTGICFLIILWGLVGTLKNKDFYKAAGLMALMAGGFSAMSIQIIILFSFQVIYGYLFYQIGLLLTVFMAGLAAGSFFISILMKHFKKPLRFLALAGILFSVLSLGLPLLFSWLSFSGKEFILQLGAGFIFPLFSLFTGLIAGMQFPVVNKIYLVGKQQKGRVSGLTYGVDLLGSSFGAFLTGVFLIPVLGITWSCFTIAAVNLSVLSVLNAAGRYYSR
ncbi:MAG: fused MFS/spermidine synthase [Candidatus Omnitrophica bacterium]|nr:fused MFS/spermidine synthase [Candidatus Omnitrophota bacterium]